MTHCIWTPNHSCKYPEKFISGLIKDINNYSVWQMKMALCYSHSFVKCSWNGWQIIKLNWDCPSCHMQRKLLTLSSSMLHLSSQKRALLSAVTWLGLHTLYAQCDATLSPTSWRCFFSLFIPSQNRIPSSLLLHKGALKRTNSVYTIL